MAFKIDTEMKGIYIISENNIEHFFLNKHETSKGLLVKNYYQEIERALYCAWCLREGKAYESIVYYRDDPKDALRLETVIEAMEQQIDLFTDGEYSAEGEVKSRYWHEIQHIHQDVMVLKNGRYYENELHHRPGIPRIETVGRRLVDAIMDLVWRMDDDAPSIDEEISAAFRKTYQDIIPPLSRFGSSKE